MDIHNIYWQPAIAWAIQGTQINPLGLTLLIGLILEDKTEAQRREVTGL